MEPEFERYFDGLRAAGVTFRIALDCVREPDHEGPLVQGAGDTRTWPKPRPFVEYRDPAAGLAADHATESTLAAMLRRPPAGTCWEIGCGTGVLAAAAGLLGVAVVASDVHARALELARKTCAAAGVLADLREGALLEPFGLDETTRFVVANLPHKPVPLSSGLRIAQNGGPDGARVHAAFAAQAAARLPEGARVLFFLHSLPDPALLRAYAEAFDLELLSIKRRWFLPGEYGALRHHFRTREGSYVCTAGDREFLVAGVWEATRR